MTVSKELIENVKYLKKVISEVSVYDLNTYSTMELYYNIANKLNEVIKELSRFEGVVSDEVVEQNEKLLYLLGEGLTTEVIKKINQMVLDGTMDTIINSNVFNGLNSKIDTFKQEVNSQINTIGIQLDNNTSYLNSVERNIEKDLLKTETELYTTIKNQIINNINGCKIGNVFTPDGVGSYSALWTRDFAYMIEFAGEFFTKEETLDNFKFIADRIDKVHWYVADHISSTGTVYWTPGVSNSWGDRASLDGAPFLVSILYNYYKRYNDVDTVRYYIDDLYKCMTNGINYSENGLVFIGENETVCGYGFQDTVRMTGNVSFVSALCYQAFTQLSVLYSKIHNTEKALDCIKRSEKIKSSFDIFWNGKFVSSSLVGDIVVRGEIGYYKASTGVCSKQMDIWASLFACYIGLVPTNRVISVAKQLQVEIYKDRFQSNYNIYKKGGLRHTPKSSDHIQGVQMWEDYIDSNNAYGTYQSGGYWVTPLTWLVYVLSQIDYDLTQYVVLDSINNFVLVENGTYEWLGVNNEIGVKKYVASDCIYNQILTSKKLNVENYKELVLENGWINYNEEIINKAQFYKEGERVYVTGTIKNGVINPQTPCATLPYLYRPVKNVAFTGASGGSVSVISVTYEGKIIINSGVNTDVSLDGISFRCN